MYFSKIINSFFKEGESRTLKAQRNVLQMLFMKGASIIIGLLLIPLTLNYVDSETYGIWITLSTMVAWMSFFDIGISNGLKNKLAEAFAIHNYELCKKYVSTTYFMLLTIFSLLMILLLFLIPRLNWISILNLSGHQLDVINYSLIIIIVYFCVNFVLSTINVIFIADQCPAYASLCTLIQQVLTLLIIYTLTLFTSGNLLYLCFGLCISPLLVTLFYNIYFFQKRYKIISPQYSFVDLKVAPELMSLGVKFFIIQIAGIVQYQLVNFILLRDYGGQSVTEYNIAFKYFNSLNMVWSIIITPLWVAFADAIVKNDYLWIRNNLKRYMYLYVLFSLCGSIMLILSPYIYTLWIGKSVQVDFYISLWTFIYNLTWMFSSLYVSFINGSGQIKLQTLFCLITPLIFIIISYFSVQFQMPVYYIIIASIASNVYGVVIAPFQTNRILKKIENATSK